MSTIRLSGMASGMDTDSIVEKLMNVEKQKYYKVERQMYKTEYQVEAYRGVTEKLNEFKTKYLDLLGTTSMTSAGTYRKFTSSVLKTDGTSSKAVTISSTSGANAGTHSIQINQVAKKAEIKGSKVTGVLKTNAIEDFNLNGKRIEFNIDGDVKSIRLGDYSDANEMRLDLEEKLYDAFGEGYTSGSGKISVSIDEEGKFTFEAINGATNLSVEDTEDLLKFKTTSTSLVTSSKLEDITSVFRDELTFGPAADGDTENDSLRFRINGKEFKFDKSATLKDVLDEVNNDETVKVNLAYNSTTGKFTISSDKTGAGERVEIQDISGNFFEATGLAASGSLVSDVGEDTKAVVDGVEIVRNTVSFAIDGITYQANDVTDGELTVDLKLDTDEVYEKIVDFIKSYNTLIADIDKKLSEKYDKDYQPLTEDERGEMTEEQIKKWDEKAKTGLLRNDSMLTSLLTELRSCFSQSVSGVGLTFSDIGLKTGTYTDKGKIVIDDNMQKNLKDALANNLDAVVDLFTKRSETHPYSSRTYTQDERSTRMKQQGLVHKLSDVLDDYISTYRDSNGYKGKLLEKAGLVGDVTETTSTLVKQLAKYDSKLDDISDILQRKADRYYKQFSAMETAINKANSQASYLTSMFSSGNQQ